MSDIQSVTEVAEENGLELDDIYVWKLPRGSHNDISIEGEDDFSKDEIPNEVRSAVRKVINADGLSSGTKHRVSDLLG